MIIRLNVNEEVFKLLISNLQKYFNEFYAKVKLNQLLLQMCS